MHPSQPVLALAVGDRILLVDLRPPDQRELAYWEGMARFNAFWQWEQAVQHKKEATTTGKAEHRFAAAFHWGQLTEHDPGNGKYWQELDGACAGLGDWGPAVAVCDRLLRHEPTLAPACFRRARLRAHRLEFFEASADHLAGLALAATKPVGWPGIAKGASKEGTAFAAKQDWPRACRTFADAALWEQQNPRHLHYLAWAQLAAGRDEDFRASCRRLFEHYQSTEDVALVYRLSAELGLTLSPTPSLLRGLGEPTADGILAGMQRLRRSDIVSTACLVPDHGLPAAALVKVARQNAEEKRTSDVLDDLGAALYRDGQYAEAVTTLEEAIKLHGRGGSTWMKLFLAMAYHQQKQPQQARDLLRQAQLGQNPSWEERLIYQRLRQEAERLLQGDQKPQP